MTIRKKIIVSAVATSVSLSVCQVFAEERSFALEEIIVTAQKRAQSVQDIGIAIAAFSGDELREFKSNFIVDVANYTTNVQVMTGFGQPYFSIRGLGINEFSGNTDSPVAIHMDDVYLSKAMQATVAMFDVERVEVLKGPQGTLFGRNTTGGSINIITRKPTEEFEAGVDLSLANYERIGTDGYISGALAENISGRFSWTTKNSSKGITKNDFDGERLGDYDSWAARGHLIWTPSENTSALLSYTVTEDHSQPLPYGQRGVLAPNGELCAAYLNGSLQSSTPGCSNTQGFQDTDNDPYTVNQNRANQLNNEGEAAILRVEHDFGPVLLTSITSYSHFIRDFYEDSGASPFRDVEVDWYNEIDEFTQEVRLSSNSDGALKWVAGLYYQEDELEVVNTFVAVDMAGVFQSAEYVQDTKAVALFGQIEYPINDQLELITGLRYSEEDKDLDGVALVQDGSIEPTGRKSRLANPFLTLVDTANSPATREDDDLSWKVGLNYHPSNDTLVYGSITRGFKSGGFEGGFPSDTFGGFDPEEITAYEIGIKTYFMDNTLGFNASAFHYDYKDPQVNADDPQSPLPITTNAEEATYDGLEADVWWRPLEGLDVKAGIGYLDGEYGQFTVGGIDQSGNIPINTPEFTATGLVRYETGISRGISLIMLADVKWTDEKFLETSNSLLSKEDSYTLLGGRVALVSDENDWEIALWGKNLLDEEYRAYVNDLPALGFVLDIWGLPRTYGMTFSKYW